jgi:hypothetical protein
VFNPLQLKPNLFDPLASGITIFHPAALPLFEKARRKAIQRQILATMLHRPRYLCALDEDFVPPPARDDTVTIAQISLNTIKGSVNRSHDFDSDFYPLNDGLADRWIRLASMMMQGASIPPADLLVVSGAYYVIDGHHRISVYRMLGLTDLDVVLHTGL